MIRYWYHRARGCHPVRFPSEQMHSWWCRRHSVGGWRAKYELNQS